MGRKPAIQFYGVIFIIGLLVQIITSMSWQNLAHGETIFMIGQNIGELCYFFVCRKLFEKHGLFMAVAEFGISLILVDMFTVLFLNPYEISPSKYAGFVIASGVLLFRIKKYIQPNAN